MYHMWQRKKNTVKCEGCLQIFCLSHLVKHCLELIVQLDELEVNRDVL
jgi:hypothetical protein